MCKNKAHKAQNPAMSFSLLLTCDPLLSALGYWLGLTETRGFLKKTTRGTFKMSTFKNLKLNKQDDAKNKVFKVGITTNKEEEVAL